LLVRLLLLLTITLLVLIVSTAIIVVIVQTSPKRGGSGTRGPIRLEKSDKNLWSV
jgi:cell division protein FtsL